MIPKEMFILWIADIFHLFHSEYLMKKKLSKTIVTHDNRKETEMMKKPCARMNKTYMQHILQTCSFLSFFVYIGVCLCSMLFNVCLFLVLNMKNH